LTKKKQKKIKKKVWLPPQVAKLHQFKKVFFLEKAKGVPHLSLDYIINIT
jgi:hypothetical protein